MAKGEEKKWKTASLNEANGSDDAEAKFLKDMKICAANSSNDGVIVIVVQWIE